MPLIPATDEPRTYSPEQRGIQLQPLGDQPKPLSPGFFPTVTAAARQSNEIVSFLAGRDVEERDRYRIEDGFDLFATLKKDKRDEQANRYLDVFNTRAYEARKAQLDMEDRDRRTLDAAGFWGDLASIGAAVASPTSLLPGGQLYRGVKGGYALGKSALSLGVAAAAGTAVQEAGLQATQETRTAKETTFAIGGAALLGGLLGGGAGLFLNGVERRALSKGLDDLARTDTPDVQALNEAAVGHIMGTEPQSAGAAAVRRATLEENTVAGRMAGWVNKASSWARLNPLVRLSESPEALVRAVSGGLMEEPRYMKKNFEGVASEAAVETLVKEFSRGAVARSMVDTDVQFKAFRKAGGVLNHDEFKQAVGRAMRRSDGEALIPGETAFPDEVMKAAAVWRKEVFDPLKQQAIEAKLLPADVDVKTAESYFSRLWNWRNIEANEPQFKEIVRNWTQGEVAKEVERLTVNRDARRARIEQELADIQLPAEERARLLESLPAELKQQEADNPLFSVMDKSLGGMRSREFALRQQAREAATPQERYQATQQAEQLRDRVKAIKEKAGKDYADYVTKRNVLQSRVRRIQRNIAGRESKVEQIRERLADGEQANIERLERMYRSVQILEGKMDAADPATWQADMSNLRAQFAKVLERSNKAQDKLAQANAASREEAAVMVDGKPSSSAIPLDFYGMLDAARARLGADPEKKMPKRPVLGMLKQAGGVDPESPLAGELRNMGVNPKTAPGLFKRGGMGAADNFPVSESPLFRDVADDGNGYIPEETILEAIRDEMFGAARRTPEELQALEEFRIRGRNSDYFRQELDSLGVDIDKMSNREVMQKLSEIQEGRNYLADLENVPPPKGEEDYGAVPISGPTKREAEITARIDQRTKIFEAVEAKRVEEMNQIADRIGTMELTDPEEAIRALRNAIDTRIMQASQLVGREAERMVALARMMKEADPEIAKGRIKDLEARREDIERRYADRVDIGLDGQNNYESYVDDIVTSIYNQLTGRTDSTVERDIVPTARGPLKERTFNIPDRLVEDYLESNVELVGRRYARIMAAEVELARKFGAPNMKDTLSSIEQAYTKRRARIQADPELKETQRAKQIAALNARERADKRDIEAVRDMLRGTYLAQENRSMASRVVTIASSLNYLRSMGGVVLSSLTDVARPMMVHGLRRYMGDGIAPLVKNLKAVKLSVQEAKLAGAVSERILNTRMATWSEITDPYSHRSPFEAFLENTTKGFSKLNWMVYWNDFMKSFSATMTQNRILEGVGNHANLGKREAAYLAFLGIDGNMAERIAKEFQAHGSTEGGVRIASTEDWTDVAARRAYRAAVNKDVDSIIVTKGVGDVPLFAHTPLGRTVLQFKSFALASHQRAFMRGLQEAPTGAIAGMMTSVAIGMFIYWLKAVELNRQDTLSDNPGHWLAEGFDRSAIAPVLFEVNNTIEKALGIGVYGALQAAFPEKEKAGKASRYLTRSVAASFAGPTGDFADTLVKVVNGMKDGDMKDSDLNAIRRLAPGGTLPVVRSILEYGIMPAARASVAD